MAIKTVTFHWDDSHGECYDCGRPAAFFADGQEMCGVCAANHAVDGETITRIDPNFDI